MENATQPSVVDTGIQEIKQIKCIEASPVEDITFIAGELTSSEARESCPVLVIDLASHSIKCKLHNNN